LSKHAESPGGEKQEVDRKIKDWRETGKGENKNKKNNKIRRNLGYQQKRNQGGVPKKNSFNTVKQKGTKT